jgi:hypothetical protein
MTWKEFSIIVMGQERKELNEWARTRQLAYVMYLSNSAEKSPKPLKSFWPIPELDEDDEEKVFITDEQLKRTLKLYGVN